MEEAALFQRLLTFSHLPFQVNFQSSLTPGRPVPSLQSFWIPLDPLYLVPQKLLVVSLKSRPRLTVSDRLLGKLKTWMESLKLSKPQLTTLHWLQSVFSPLKVIQQPIILAAYSWTTKGFLLLLLAELSSTFHCKPPTMYPSCSRPRHSNHVSILSYGADLAKFYFSSIHTYFQASLVDIYQAVLLQPPINHVTISCDNHNLSPPQKELILWYYRLGHLGLQHVQSLLVNQWNPVVQDCRIIQPLKSKCSNIHRPLCAACLFSRQKRTLPPTHTASCRKRAGSLSNDITSPGQRVSCDLYCSSTLGWLL